MKKGRLEQSYLKRGKDMFNALRDAKKTRLGFWIMSERRYSPSKRVSVSMIVEKPVNSQQVQMSVSSEKLFSGTIFKEGSYKIRMSHLSTFRNNENHKGTYVPKIHLSASEYNEAWKNAKEIRNTHKKQKITLNNDQQL